MRIMIALALLILILLIASPAETATIHVPADQPTIQAGIDAASEGDTVLVADGVYSGAGNHDLDFSGKAITVRSENGYENCIIDGQELEHVGFIFISGEGPDSVVEGLTIRDFQMEPGPYQYEGETPAVYCEGASPTIVGNLITGTCGGITLYDSTARIVGNQIIDNDFSGIYCSGGAPSVEDNLIRDNWNFSGGGIHCVHDATITGNVIEDNHAGGWEHSGSGGGIYCRGYGTVTITDNLISGNVCSVAHLGGYGGSSGGGVHASGGILAPGSVFIGYNRIIGNQAKDDVDHTGIGGGVFCNGQVTVFGNIITGNWTDFRGGGAYCQNEAIVANNLIAGNSTTQDGGGLYCWRINSANPRLRNNTLTGNSADSGGGLYCSGGGGSFRDRNSIYWNNNAATGKEIVVRGSGTELTIDYALVQGGQASVHLQSGATLLWGAGMIDADPLFVSGPEGDHYLSQVAAGQASDSPGLDAGAGLAAKTCIDTDQGQVCLDQRSTRTDGPGDIGQVDLGYHYSALSGTIAAELHCAPASGTVPFDTDVTVVIHNLYQGQARKLSGRIDIRLANGSTFSNWRYGHTNIPGGDSYGTGWSQQIPALASLVGDNVFTLYGEDITPPPWNLPPYPPAGDTDTEICTVTGVAP